MTNSESLDCVGDAIRSAERELSTLDGLTESAATTQKTIDKLTTDVADLHANVADLEPKVRASKLTNAQALLSLERSDLVTVQCNPCAVSILVENHRSVAAIKQLVAGSDYYAIGISPDAKIQALRER